MYIFVATRNKTNVCMIVFSLFHAAFFYLREIIHPPCHVPVTLSHKICTECFERLVNNILQGDKMLHFLYFV